MKSPTVAEIAIEPGRSFSINSVELGQSPDEPQAMISRPFVDKFVLGSALNP